MVRKSTSSLARVFIAASTIGCASATYRPWSECVLDVPVDPDGAKRRGDDTYSIMSLNIKDIPVFYEPDPILKCLIPDLEIQDPKILPPMKERAPCLGKFAQPYDLVALQEAFQYSARMEQEINYPWSWAPAFERHDFISVVSPMATSPGLMFFSAYPEKTVQGYAVPFHDCSGVLSENMDCLARKGYQVVAFGSMHIVNTHLDSGRPPGSHAAREKQLEQMADDLPHGPLLIAGDFNLSSARDEAALEKFMKKTDTVIALRNEIDMILVRDVQVTETKLIPIGRLTDHNAALTARFRMPGTIPHTGR